LGKHLSSSKLDYFLLLLINGRTITQYTIQRTVMTNHEELIKNSFSPNFLYSI